MNKKTFVLVALVLTGSALFGCTTTACVSTSSDVKCEKTQVKKSAPTPTPNPFDDHSLVTVVARNGTLPMQYSGAIGSHVFESFNGDVEATARNNTQFRVLISPLRAADGNKTCLAAGWINALYYNLFDACSLDVSNLTREEQDTLLYRGN